MGKKENIFEYYMLSNMNNYIELEKLILEKAEELGYSKNKLFNIKLACEEAVSNAVKHGNKSDESKKVKVKVEYKNNLEIIVVDEGQGFNPNNIPDCTEDSRLNLSYGRGIFLMRSFADKVKYNEKGNKVKLTFNKQ